jgi:hypothetical protein
VTIAESQAIHKHILTPLTGESSSQMWARAWQFTNNVCFDNPAYAMIKKTGGQVCGPGVDCDKIIEIASPHRIYDLVRNGGAPNAEPIFDDTHHTGKPSDFTAPLPYDGTAPVPMPPQPPMPTQPPGREEALDEMNWLDGYYAAPEGLQRPNGLSLNGKPDFEGIAAWYLDIYQRERMAMKTRADARAAYVSQIRHSAEWQSKHPGETP